MLNPYDIQQANALAMHEPGATSAPPALNALAQIYQPLVSSAPNALGTGSPMTGDAERDRALQFILANKLALDGPNGDFLRALKAFHAHFANQGAQPPAESAQAPQAAPEPSVGGPA